MPKIGVVKKNSTNDSKKKKNLACLKEYLSDSTFFKIRYIYINLFEVYLVSVLQLFLYLHINFRYYNYILS